MSRNRFRAADELLAQVAADPWGQVTASAYETGRLVAIAPWLAGHGARLAYLCRSQHPDGGWGGYGGYALVSSLSATGALLAELRRGGPSELDRAATTGLRALHRCLAPGTPLVVPDTIASELVVPALVAEVNQLAAGSGPALPLPDGFHPRTLERVRSGLAAGVFAPGLAYSLEVFDAAATACPLVRPAGGAVGLSPAATAAWLGGPNRHPAAHQFLDRVQARGGGPVPVVTPITYFEAAWVLNSLAPAGLSCTVPAVILDRLEAGLDQAGAPVAPGLPPDADDTGAVLAALLRHGRSRSPESLLGFHADGYFRCYHGERDPSVSTNAHALDALALYLAQHPQPRQPLPRHAPARQAPARDRFAAVAAATARWLLEVQQPDGSWRDKWHASPYYATAGCVLALASHGGPGTAEAIARAVAWVRDTERPDGSWGRWRGTVEETAYAVQILTHAPGGPAVTAALGRAARFLARPAPAEHPPLWHGKDLYTPVRVVRAAHLAARVLAERHTGPVSRLPRQRGEPQHGEPQHGEPQHGEPQHGEPQRRASAQVGAPVEAHGQM